MDEDRWAMGSVMALAFNDPKKLSQLARERREAEQEQAELRAKVPLTTRLANMFASAGAHVIRKG